jgi:immune inhibitor InhA-like protein
VVLQGFGVTVQKNFLSQRLLILLALFSTACAAGGEEPFNNGNDGGGGSGASGGQGGFAGGQTGGGGEGGSMGPCEVDCEAIMVPQCLKSVCNEGQYMGTVGTCVVVDDDDGVACEDGEFCTINDQCMAGQCTGGPQNTCGMMPAGCELITCNEASMDCTAMPAMNGGACTPANLCDVNGHCTNGLCVGMPKDCFFAPVPNECHTSACDPMTGQCTPQVNPGANGMPCSGNGDLCMDGKTCDTMGNCLGGTPKDCSAFTMGCQNGVCDPMNGACIGDPVPPGGLCVDGNDECNQGICDMNANCVPTPLPDGTTCNDFNTCTDNDICTAGVCDGNPVMNCSTYFEVGFEGNCPPPGWTLTGDWQCGVPVVDPNMAHTGTQVIGTILNGNYANNLSFATCNAQTPVISLATAVNPVLSLYAWTWTENQPFDGWNIKISTDGGNTFSVLGNVSPAYNGVVVNEQVYTNNQSALGYQLITADLTAYVGQQIILRFSMRTDGSVTYSGVTIDDVTVQEQAAQQIVITTPSLPNAYTNQPYVANLTRIGGSPQAVWSITGGMNHGWLSINPTTGQLSGTPVVQGPVTVDVHIVEPSFPTNFADASFTFDVQSAIFSENFEGVCPNGWTLTGDWQCGVPVSNPSNAYSGTQALGTILNGNYNNNLAFATCNAQSPPISLVGAVNPTLALRAWTWTENQPFDGWNVKISTDGGVNFSVVGNVVPAYNGLVAGEQVYTNNQSALGYQLITADLTAYAGQTIVLRFSMRTDSSVTNPGVTIDDVVISD